MWHEARKQEKKIRGLMVDYKKRAERRREFYEKIKLDPTQFLRIYGRPCKINLEPAVAIAAESPQSMMPWQGQTDNMIDRFDVRAHLDYMPQFNIVAPVTLNRQEEEEERLCCYERYRTLVENECAGLPEEQCLHQIYVDEQFGPITRSYEEEKKKALAEKKAAIGYTYDDSTGGNEDLQLSDDESSDTDVETADLDITLDIDTLNAEQKEGLNLCAQSYGMKKEDYTRLLAKDKEELEALRQAKMLEEEKAQFAGRKSRRERRAYKEKRLAGRKLSPPSYAARDSPKYEPYKKRSSSSSRSRSRSRSPSPKRRQKVLFITSFGGDSEEEATVQGPALPPQNYSDKTKEQRQGSCEKNEKKRSNSNGRSRSPPPRKDYREAVKAKLASRHSRSRSRSRGRDSYRSRNNDKSSYSSSSNKRRRSSSSSSRSRSRSRRRRSRSRSRSRGYGSRRPQFRRSNSRSRRSRSPNGSRSWSRRTPSRRSTSRSGTRRSRSRSKSSRSRSSRSKSSSSRSSSYSSRSRSPSKSPQSKPGPEPTIKRYRRESLSSNNSDSDSDTKDKKKEQSAVKRSSSGIAVGKVPSLTPQVRCKTYTTRKTEKKNAGRFKQTAQG